MNDWVGDPKFSRSRVDFFRGRRRVREDEMVGCQMYGSFDLLAPANQSDVVYLEMVSVISSNNTKPRATFAIRVLSIPS